MKVKIGVLPSMVTLGNLICGFAAIGVATYGLLYPDKMPQLLKGRDSFAIAGGLVLLAMVFDALDGKLARATNLTTEFGAQLDSLCDMVSFGIAPAYIVFLTAIHYKLFGHDRYAWVCAVLYVLCTALRLARFNVESQPDKSSHRYFRGLPSPGAAGVVVSLAILAGSSPAKPSWPVDIMPFASVILGALMISRIRYIHLPNLFFRGRKPLTYLVVLVFAICTLIALAQHAEYIVLAGFSAYALSGPCALPWTLARKKQAADLAQDQPPSSTEESPESSIF